MIRRNQIKYCPVTVEDVNVALNIWGKNIAALKRNTTWEKTKYIGKRLCENSYGLNETTQRSVLNARFFFVNKIPFLLTLSQKICFTAVNHLANLMVPQIFTAFKEIYQYYLHHGFRIMTVHSDG